ncbi:MAG: hypothetical protein AW06_001427 [Candidatus Accumulibacter cognatus]|uniref:Uncharacterized protein n=1 Tax=Candidatus Accumulibacter cognatus TaxID=2954383 RepID=A0A080M7Z4_9PROT|nr:MAG: hypothetical protein AW06_001427 [Candidatus Accumulibacter cognatus]
MLLLEVDEEDAPGLPGLQWTQLLDLLDADALLVLEAQVVGPVESEVFFVVPLVDGPVEFVAQEIDELRERLDGSQPPALYFGHHVPRQLSSIHARSTGATPSGACTFFR